MWRSWERCAIWRCFFQAEDGIRDKLVTGVQTCALPICHGGQVETARGVAGGRGPERRHDRVTEVPNLRRGVLVADQQAAELVALHFRDFRRSEERRVGK